MNGYERLKELYLEEQSKDKALIAIIKHLIKLPNMSKLYSNKEKRLTQIMQFINGKAKKQAVNGVAVIEDDTVYKWAEEYFTKSNDEPGLNEKQVKQSKTSAKDKVNNDQLSLEIKE